MVRCPAMFLIDVRQFRGCPWKKVEFVLALIRELSLDSILNVVFMVPPRSLAGLFHP